ncbi:MAG TPA: hypothetical protein VK645_15110 [Chitinophagaceae bacterium]|nr:hypothetical protein [Chitinophagaceae bacterium]
MKKKKLYYLPGLISIIGLPVLLFFLGPADPVYQNCIRLNLTSDAKDTIGISRFTKDYVYKSIEGKKLETPFLNGIEQNSGNEHFVYIQNKKLRFITNEIERLKFAADTNTVLKIQFGEDCAYGNFIWVLNHALIYDFKRYALINNELYFFSSKPFIPHYESLELPLEVYVMPARKEPAKWEVFKTELDYKWRIIQYQFEYLFYKQQQNILLAAGFLLLIVLPGLIKIRKYFMAYKRTYSLS